MKIIIEILEKRFDEFGEVFYCPDNDNKKVEFKTGSKEQKITDAKKKIREMKSTLKEGDKIRVLEYNNDEPDETRQPCKVVEEF